MLLLFRWLPQKGRERIFTPPTPLVDSDAAAEALKQRRKWRKELAEHTEKLRKEEERRRKEEERRKKPNRERLPATPEEPEKKEAWRSPHGPGYTHSFANKVHPAPENGEQEQGQDSSPPASRAQPDVPFNSQRQWRAGGEEEYDDRQYQ